MTEAPARLRPRGPRLDRRRFGGYTFGVLTAICWAASSVSLRKGLDLLHSPLWSVTVGLAAATVPFLVWVLVLHPPSPPSSSAVPRDPRATGAFWFLALAGVASAGGAVARTYAIDLAPIVVVIPLLQTTGLWSIVLAPPLLGRHVERITGKLVVGALLVVVGAALVVVGQNV